MTEPVAYLVSQEPLSAVRWLSDVKPIGIDDKQITPLYTEEQLHPRVKMTQSEFDEWKELYENGLAPTIYDFIIHVLNNRYSFPDMTNKLMCGSGAVKAKSQAKIADLIVNYKPDNPEETIEIVPDMKWFVRSLVADEGYYSYLFKHSNRPIADYEPSKQPRKEYMMFDTKEEAERWTNPLTEAVQLPVEV